MNNDRRFQGFINTTRGKRLIYILFDCNFHFVIRSNLHRKRNQLRFGFNMSHCQSGFPGPEVHQRDTATILGSWLHTHPVLAEKICFERKNVILTPGQSASLKRPEIVSMFCSARMRCIQAVKIAVNFCDI